MDKIRVIVAGTTFGQLYIEAIRLLAKEKFELVGILASGSERSKKCGTTHQVPLYQKVEDVPDNVDLACVVVRSNVLGGVGTDLAIQFLERGIHVIQEHPIHPKELGDCYKIAKKYKVGFQMGSLYTHLPEVKKFIQCANKLNTFEKPVFIRAAFSSQVSYPLIEILNKTMGNIRGWKMSNQTECGPFQIMNGILGNIPICMEINNRVNPDDPNNQMYLLHSIEFIYNSGRLVLEDTFGPVVWNPRMYTDVQFTERGELHGQYPKYMDRKTANLHNTYSPVSFTEVLTKMWPEAISQDLLFMKRIIDGDKSFVKKCQQDLACANIWNIITKDLGYPAIISGNNFKDMDTHILEEICKNIE